MSDNNLDNRFLRTKLLLGAENLEKLKNARVTIVGLGAVGSFVGEALIRSGVGNLRLFDFDKVSETNINRCLLATQESIGEYKVLVAKRRYEEINPKCNIEAFSEFISKENINLLLENKPDVIVDAIDSVNPKVNILEEISKTSTPIISSMGAALKTDPFSVHVSSIHNTVNCTLAKWVRKNLRKRGVTRDITCVYSSELPKNEAVVNTELLNETREYDRGRERNTMGSMIIIPGIFGLTIANLVIKKILKN